MICAPGIAPVAVHAAAVGGMTEIDPASGLLPHCRSGVAIGAHDAGYDCLAISRDSNRRVEGVSGTEIDKATSSGPAKDFSAKVGGHDFAVIREREVYPRKRNGIFQLRDFDLSPARHDQR